MSSFSKPERFSQAVDLGCGTGLSGLAFRNKALHQQDLVDFLNIAAMFYDLFVLTDVFIYLGNLRAAFAAIGEHSRPGALILFSIEICHRADFVLRTSGRYAQSRSYIERLAAENNMIIDHQQETGIRKEKGQWIDGEIYILRKI